MLEDLHEWGWKVSKKTVEAPMARQGLVAGPKRRFRSLIRPDKAAPAVPDLVQRHFSASGLGPFLGSGTVGVVARRTGRTGWASS